MMTRSKPAFAMYSSTSPTPPGTPLSSLVQNPRTIFSAAATGVEEPEASRRRRETS
jgi:hypothetical protein